jgi:glycine/D-amino acid oxidase-like deaminating enzyme
MKVLVETGGIDVVKKTQPTYQALIKACASNGVVIEEISAAELKARYQLNFSDEHVGVLQASSGILHATTAVAMYQSLAIKHGAELRDNAKVVARRSILSEGTTLERLELADGTPNALQQHLCVCV